MALRAIERAPEVAHPLRDETYRRLFIAQVTSLLGTGLTTVALALLAHDLSGAKAGAVLGTILALKMVAYIVVAPAFEAIAHRLPRKAVLVALDLVRATIVGLMPLADALWQVYGLVLALNVAAAGFTPTFQATIPDVLPDGARYVRALSLSRLAYDLESLASPTLAALALMVMSYDGLFLADAITFVVSAALVRASSLPPQGAHERSGRALTRMIFGVRSYLRTPRLRGLLALHLAASAAGAMVIVNTVVYARERLGLGEAATAWAMAAAGGGSMSMALIVPRLIARRRDAARPTSSEGPLERGEERGAARDRRVMLGGGVFLSVALVVGGMGAPSLPWLLAIWASLGVGMSAISTPAGGVVRRSCRPGDRSAFFAAEFALSHAAWLVSYLAAGLLGAWLGPEAALVALGALAGGAALAAALLWPAHEPAAIEHAHSATVHEHVHVHDAHHQHAHEGSEGPEPHSHPHEHPPARHSHEYMIDLHHSRWPKAAE